MIREFSEERNELCGCVGDLNATLVGGEVVEGIAAMYRVPSIYERALRLAKKVYE